jgi:hypothetical protein
MKYNFETYYEDERKESINHPAFLIEFFERGDYGQIYIRPVYLYTNTRGEQAYSFYDKYISECILHWFQISSQYNLHGDAVGIPYAYKTGYADENVISMDDIEEATMKLKFISKIAKTVLKLRDEFGYTQSFGEYVMYIAKAMGIKTFITRYNLGDTTNGSFRTITPSNVRQIIDNIPVHHKVGA